MKLDIAILIAVFLFGLIIGIAASWNADADTTQPIEQFEDQCIEKGYTPVSGIDADGRQIAFCIPSYYVVH